MDVETASLFFALLAVACLVAVAVLAVGWLAWWTSRAPALWSIRVDLGRLAVPLAWLVATVATLGSLYYSEIADFVPCKLCWYQRICMYPLAVLLGVAAFRRDRSIRFYAGPLAAIGAVIASYHAWIQAYPPSNGTSFCTADAPCTERYVWEFGFVSLPLMALAGFLFVVTMMVLARPPLEEIAEEEHGAFGDDLGNSEGLADDVHGDGHRSPAAAGG